MLLNHECALLEHTYSDLHAIFLHIKCLKAFNLVQKTTIFFKKIKKVPQTYITFVWLRIRVLFRMLVEIILGIEYFIADGTNVRFLLGMLPHVIK